MTEAQFDKMLRAGLLTAAARDGQETENWLASAGLRPGPRYLRWEERFLTDPFGFAKRALRPHWKGVLRTVLIAAALTALLLAGALAVSPALRAWVVNWLTYQETTHTTHVFENPAYGESGYTFENLPDNVRPGWMPEGYEEVQCDSVPGAVYLTYENKDGDLLRFEYWTIDRENVFQTNSEYHKTWETTINGMQVFAAQSERPDVNSSYIIWINEPMNVTFRIAGKVDMDTLFCVLQSVPALF